MKIHKAQLFVVTIGLFLVSFLLEKIVSPIKLGVSSPYAFLDPTQFVKFPFTSVVIVIRAFSFFLAPLFLLSFIPHRYFVKIGILLIIGSLCQLYSLQETVSGPGLLPIEWAISISLAGALLVIPIIYFVLKGIFLATKAKLTRKKPQIDEQLDSIK